VLKKINHYLSLVKFAHTLFALPFAVIGFFLAIRIEDKEPTYTLGLLVLLCMVFARNTAMGFNRYIDRNIDIKNERTSTREIPAKTISPVSALLFVILNAVLFIIATFFINRLCFFLSPVALIVIMGYSFTKKFTFLCHLILGIGLSLAPVGAYIAVTGYFKLLPVLFSFAVLFWVSGFDIIYALQDIDFDKTNKLKSIPVKLGIKKSLMLSSIFHIITMILIIFAGLYQQLGIFYWIGSAIFIILLFYQHIIIKPTDLSKVNVAFFTTNGYASVLFGLFVVLDLFVKI
jgi:4-hydroxybenzoate polyprenyltransferase